MRARFFAALSMCSALACVACTGDDSGNVQDASIDLDAADAMALPAIDAATCPALDASEAPLTFSRAYAFLDGGSFVQDKGFYFITVLQDSPTVLADLLMDPTLAAASTSRDSAIRNAASTCSGDATCITNALAFSSSDIASIASAISARLVSSGNLAAIVTSQMRPSGAFNAHATLSDSDLVAQAWTDSANWLNGAIATYAKELTATQLQNALNLVIASHSAAMNFFTPAMALTLAILDADNRDNAAEDEPIDQGENRAVLSNIPSIDFSKYAFSMLVVPGIGPTDSTTMISEGSKTHADLAAARFAAKFAPIFALTGGRVHPDRTTYAEALEMKSYLMSTYGIPENVIVVDPYARHTTTNLRNVSRYAFRYGIPTNKPALVVTDYGQTLTINSATFLTTSLTEMNLVAWREVAELSQNDTCFLPSVIVLQQNGADPLDP
jgi:hypothetical protein